MKCRTATKTLSIVRAASCPPSTQQFLKRNGPSSAEHSRSVNVRRGKDKSPVRKRDMAERTVRRGWGRPGRDARRHHALETRRARHHSSVLAEARSDRRCLVERLEHVLHGLPNRTYPGRRNNPDARARTRRMGFLRSVLALLAFRPCLFWHAPCLFWHGGPGTIPTTAHHPFGHVSLAHGRLVLSAPTITSEELSSARYALELLELRKARMQRVDREGFVRSSVLKPEREAAFFRGLRDLLRDDRSGAEGLSSDEK